MESLGDILRRIKDHGRTSAAIEDSPPAKCSICRDTGFIGRECAVGHPHFGKVYPCRCTWEHQGRPTFDSFRAANPAMADARQQVINWADGMAPYLLTLAGQTGVGKTHLAEAAHLVLMRRGETVLFQTEASVLTRIHSAMRPDAPFSVESVLSEVMTTPWLILDDLGVTAQGEWDRSQMDTLINVRWQGAQRRLHTLITTNLTGTDLPERMASRLRDTQWAKAVVIQAVDYRTGR